MICLSLFDGMSCGRIAFDRAGIPIKKYYASEIDKYAQIVSAANYPDIIRLGDIEKWREWNIENPDIIIGGSPCQGFSFVGKQLNFEDERSKLFFVFVEILKHYKPKYFLLENVVMKKEYNDVISSMLGEIYPECITQKELFRHGRLEPIQINSALVSAQNRERLYWTNIPNATHPKDKGIFLKDIIETGEVEKGISEKSLKYIINKKGSPDKNLERKSKCFTAGAHSCGTHSDMDLIPVCLSGVEKDNLILIGHAKNIKGHDYNKRVYSAEGKSPSLCGATGGNLEPKIAMKQLQHEYNRGSEKICGKAPPITSSAYEQNNFIGDMVTWRKLTPMECERLQTVPDNFTNHVSNSQRYKMLGNGWTVDVIAHIFSFISAPDKLHPCQ